MKTNQKYYAMVSSDNSAAWGSAKTKIGALRNGNQWLDEKMTMAQIESAQFSGDMIITECTKRLHNRLQENGFDFGMCKNDDGILDLV